MKAHRKPVAALATALLFITAPATAAPKTALEFRLVVACAPDGATSGPLTLGRSRETLCVSRALIADLSNVTAASVGSVNGYEAIRVTLDPAGAARMTAATAHDGVRMGVLLDGALVSAPTVYGAIGKDVEVDFGEQGTRLKQIAAALQAGLKQR